MIQILETVVTAKMSLPEARVLHKVLECVSIAYLKDKGGLSDNEIRAYNEIYTAFKELIESREHP